MLDDTAFWRFKVSSNKYVPCGLEGDFPGQVSGLQASVTGASSSTVLLATFVSVDDEEPDQGAYKTELYEVNLLAETITSPRQHQRPIYTTALSLEDRQGSSENQQSLHPGLASNRNGLYMMVTAATSGLMYISTLRLDASS